jgi:hypothetical protein
MTCYTHHLKDEIVHAGLSDDTSGRREADRRLRAALHAEHLQCNELWHELKGLPKNELGRLMAGERHER